MTTREHIHTQRHTATHARARFNWPHRQDPRFARTDPHPTTQDPPTAAVIEPTRPRPPGNRRAAIQRRNQISEAAGEAREGKREGEGGRGRERREGEKEGRPIERGARRHASSRIDDPHRPAADPRVGESPRCYTSFAPRDPGRTDGTPRATSACRPATAHGGHGALPSQHCDRAATVIGAAARDPVRWHRPEGRRPTGPAPERAGPWTWSWPRAPSRLKRHLSTRPPNHDGAIWASHGRILGAPLESNPLPPLGSYAIGRSRAAGAPALSEKKRKQRQRRKTRLAFSPHLKHRLDAALASASGHSSQ